MNSIKIKADATEMNKQMERSAKILADAAKKSQVSIQDVGKAFAKISTIDYNIPVASFSSYTANNPKYWKELQKEVNQMNYKDLKRDNTIYHCSRTDNGFTYLFRFIGDENKQIINCDTGEIFDDYTALQSSNVNKYRLANLEEQCRFYNEFGYKDAKGRVWKVDDNDPNGNKIEKFETDSRSEKICIKYEYEDNRTLWMSIFWLDKYDGESPMEKSISESIQESLDVTQEFAKSGYMTINQCRESISPTKPEKSHWFKRFMRRIV